MALTIINTVLLPATLTKYKNIFYRLPLFLCILLSFIMCFFIARAGFISDELGIGGHMVAPFYGHELVILATIGLISLLYQIFISSLLKKKRD
jgi:hypothetical protein